MAAKKKKSAPAKARPVAKVRKAATKAKGAAKATKATKTKGAAKAAKHGSSPATATFQRLEITAEQLADLLGAKITPSLKTAEVQRLRRALPGYVSHLDDASEQLGRDAASLGIKDVTPADLLALKERQQFLAEREAVAQAVHRSLYEQRLVTDDEAIGVLRKIARRVNAISEDQPALLDRWKFLLDFLGTFKGGPGAPVDAGPPAEPAPNKP